ncbi:MAG: DUF1659 domain-containing protein [Desulfotomaculaceae bacterium]|nr:DUF1659 domain-containing protein [Desulfotomaculaceae bacterium]
MAVTKVPGNSTLRLVLHVGDSGSGSPILRTKSLSNVKTTAADQDILNLATALAGLQDFPLNGVTRVDNAALIQA